MLCEKNKCTACYACYNICPKNCINMIEDECGHVFPEIDKKNCIECGLCKNYCPSISGVERIKSNKAYAGWSLDEEERRSSSSGGAASVFSKYIIDNNGVVFGVAVKAGMEVEHIKVETAVELDNLKGSKYVQSKIGSIFKDIKECLTNNKMVLFIGTPCQVAGLKKYIKNDYKNLITVDLICHGVPSQKLLKDYIVSLDDNIKADNISFRDENGFNFKIVYDNKISINIPMKESLYYIGFMNSLFYRENCYTCMYANINRVSDITIGDFWGLGNDKQFKHSKEQGVSLILPNTEKGNEFVKGCSNKLFLEERDIMEAINGNSQLRKPSNIHRNYYKFKRKYKKYGFERAANICLKRDINIEKVKDIIRGNTIVYKVIKKIKI